MREDSGRVVSIHGKGNVVFGDLHGDFSLQEAVLSAFNSHYKVTIEKDIEAWLLTHYTFILPMNSVLFINDFDAKKLSKSKADLNRMIEATDEGVKVLKENGINITPASQGKLISDYKKLYYFAMKIYFKLPMNKVVSGSFDEIVALYKEFETLKNKTKVEIKNWNELEKNSIKKYNKNRMA